MSYSDTQKLYMVAGVLALALLIGGIVMAMRKKSEKDSEDYQAPRATKKPPPVGMMYNKQGRLVFTPINTTQSMQGGFR